MIDRQYFKFGLKANEGAILLVKDLSTLRGQCEFKKVVEFLNELGINNLGIQAKIITPKKKEVSTWSQDVQLKELLDQCDL